MASEIRVNTINSRTGLGTITVSETGQDFAGISTFGGEVTIPTWLVHAGDTNTKFGFEGPDTITAETAGSERLRIHSTGEVTIGTVTGTGNNLTVQDDGSSTSAGGNIVARFQSNGSGRDATIQLSDNVANSATISMLSSALIFKQAGTETLRIDSSGRLLTGLTSSVRSTAYLQLKGANKCDLALYWPADAATAGGSISWLSDGGATATETARISGLQKDTGADGGYLSLYTHNGTAMAENMRIDSSGRVLIGTTTEGHTSADDLTVATSGSTGITIRSGTSDQGSIYFSDNTTGNGEYVGYVRYDHSGNNLAIGVDTVERVRITSDGNLGLGSNTSPVASAAAYNTASMHIHQSQSGSYGSQIHLTNAATGAAAANGVHISMWSDDDLYITNQESDGMIKFGSGGNSDVLVIDDSSNIRLCPSAGQIYVGKTSGDCLIDIDSSHYVVTSSGKATTGINIDGTAGNAGERGGAISFQCGATGAAAIAAHQITSDADQVALSFFTHNSSTGSDDAVERMRLGSSVASIYCGAKTTGEISISSSDTGEIGCTFNGGGQNSYHIMAAASHPVLYVCRRTNDGTLVTFMQDTGNEGNISVSGSTVSYNGGHLSRWSQLDGISATDKSTRPTIYQGTVMSNLDKMCEWKHADVLYTEEDTIPDGKSIGDVREAAHTEDNQQLNMTKVSDTVGDKNVAGVFWNWDDEDDEYVNDFYIAMTGDMVIRVAGSVTVEKGDLMESAGDGTAKPQSDDIVRSKTIAKIASNVATATYADGSKAYPCALMAC